MASGITDEKGDRMYPVMLLSGSESLSMCPFDPDPDTDSDPETRIGAT